MMKRLDIAIAGCGVAGLSAAALLRAQGARVVIFDQFESPRPLGSGIIMQPVGMAVLDEIGCGDALRALGAPITRLHGRNTPRQNVVLDVRYDAHGADAPSGLGVHRGTLFQVLYAAALTSGVEIESGWRIVSACDGRLHFGDGAHSPRFDLIIDALGARSPLSTPARQALPFGALWASLDWADGFDPAALEQRYLDARKMVGVMPIGRLKGASHNQAAFFWSLKHEERAAWAAGDLDHWKDEVRTLWPTTEPLLAQIQSHDDLVFAVYSHRTLSSPLSRDAVHVGDSWHCTSPQLGQGANMALLDALALSRALTWQSDLSAALDEYARLRLWHIRLYQAASWMFTPAYQSDSKAFALFRDWVVAPLSRIPPAPKILAALVAGQIGAPLSAMRD